MTRAVMMEDVEKELLIHFASISLDVRNIFM